MRKLYSGNNRFFDSDYVVVHYCEASDMTFITYEHDNLIELAGFYFGEPSESETEAYIGSMVSVAEMEEE